MTAPRVLRLTFVTPPRQLLPNGSRGHWATHARYARLYRAACWLSALSQKPDGWEPLERARMSLAFHYCRGRRTPDNDNCVSSFKPGRDSLRDAGILRDDSARRLSYGSITAEHCPPGCRCGGRVEVELTEVP